MATRTKAKTKPTQKVRPDKSTLVPPETNSLLGRAAVAAALDVSIRVFAEMVHDGEFPRHTLKAGKSPRWTREDVNTWIKDQQVKYQRKAD